jgi:acyl dehydratase
MSNEALPETQQLGALTGHRLGPYMSYNPVSATQIWQWCSAMGDRNPCYRPGERQLAPPAMMQMWTMRDIDDRCAPGSTDARQYKVFGDMEAMGYPFNVAVSYDIRFHRYLHIGERVQHYSTVATISDRKTTALGVGYFVTERVEYLTLDDDLFAEALITYFQYATVEKEAEGKPAAPSTAGRVDGQSAPAGGASFWQTDHRDVDVSALAVGVRLPELAIPITHKLIVGGAFATQDFTPVHHNVPAAKAAGMPDIFMNILTTCGLSARYLTDWAGTGSRLQELKFDLRAPNHPGDVMVMSGEVVALELQPPGALATIEFRGTNRLGVHTSGTATLALPGRAD